MLQRIKNIAEFSDNTYGERRIQKALNTLDFPAGRRKTAQLMKEANVWLDLLVHYTIRKSIKQQPTVTIRSLYMIMNLNRISMFNALIKRGYKILRTYGLLRDGCI